MKRGYRLRRPDQFRRVRRAGRTVSHQLLLLNFVANHRRQTRFGFIVGKRVGKAVQRNRARRRVREAVRLVLEHVAAGMDLVFVVRTAEVATVPFSAVEAAVEYVLRRAGVWCDVPASSRSENEIE